MTRNVYVIEDNEIIRNKFIDGFEMLLGRQAINQKNKDILQTNLMAGFKIYD